MRMGWDGKGWEGGRVYEDEYIHGHYFIRMYHGRATGCKVYWYIVLIWKLAGVMGRGWMQR